jgi:drug/metabolite transporter (DMT)-like permease
VTSISRPALAVATACVLWGLAFLFAKIALVELGTMHLVLYRFAIASAVLAGVVVRIGQLPNWRDVPLLVLTGGLCVPLTMLTQFAGLERTSVASASLIIGAGPPLIALAAFLVHRERLEAWGWAAIFLSTLGVGIMVGLPGPNRDWTGDGLVFLSMCFVPLWVLLSLRFVRLYSATLATAYILIGGTLTLVPITIGWSGLPPTDLSGQGWSALLALAIACTVAPFLLWNWGVGRMEAGRAGVFINLEPVVGAASGIALLGDSLTGGAVAGGALILVASAIVTRS